MKANYNHILVFFISIFTFVSCADDPDPVLPEPTATGIEIGSNNSREGFIGRDFHFDANVIAGERIADVIIRILQKESETYTAPWQFEIVWTEFNGVRNANIHKHFDIPDDAPEGTYDFYFIVNDQNGTRLEIREDFRIIAP